MHRRQFLQTSAVLAGAALLPAHRVAAAPAAKPFVLKPGLTELALGESPVRTRFWAYNGAVPGPLLRLRKGELARLTVDNALPVETAVHWHGVRVPNAMDGVPFVTQEPIKPGAQFAYEFAPPDSGTFWYHPHMNSHEQVGRGLYGPLIVEEQRPPQVDREVVWLLSDLKLGEDQQPIEDFGRIMDLANDGRIGNRVLINGVPAGPRHALGVRAGERLRLRLINAASARIFNLGFAGHVATVIAYDGQAVQPHPIEILMLGPGMRADLIIDFPHKPKSEFAISDNGQRGIGTLATIAYDGQKPLRDKAPNSSIRLAPNALAEPKLAQATDHYIVFHGGMRGAPVIGTIDGKPTKIQELMEKHGLAWTMNFTAEHEHALMHEPLLYLKKGEHVLLRMINETDFAHPMHLHGHFFRVVAVNGQKTRLQEWRDTVMMAPRTNIDVAFVADNLGEWMFHCHILDHAAGGMMGTIAVE
jgi:FtsP/CotA-like multicopper oxidase with cupredoxin domain